MFIWNLEKFFLTVITTTTFMMSASAADNLFIELPRDLEVELALSALPQDMQDGATVYARDPEQGFVVHRQGTNGWSTFVARTSVRFYDADWDYDYPADQLIPQAHDAVGMAHHVAPYFDLAKMRIDGVSAAEAKRRLRQRFADGAYKAPTTGGISYMLSPIHRAYLDPASADQIMTFSFPHHMPYAPNMPVDGLGNLDPQRRVGTLDHGGTDTGPHGYWYFMAQPDQVEAIRARHADLLLRLCEYHSNWCLPQL